MSSRSPRSFAWQPAQRSTGRRKEQRRAQPTKDADIVVIKGARGTWPALARPSYLHLRGARFLLSSSLQPLEGMPLRIRLDRVDAWTVNGLGAEE